jgi:hypothetical protein
VAVVVAGVERGVVDDDGWAGGLDFHPSPGTLAAAQARRVSASPTGPLADRAVTLS